MEDFYFTDESDNASSFFEDPAAKVAKDIFGVATLYPWQRLVIANIMECAQRYEQGDLPQEDQDDFMNKGRQVVLLPTGAGKSMCFMVPSVLLNRPTLVVYPLLALMNDQLRRIEKAGLQAVLFRGQQTKEERQENFAKLRGGAKLILANPEVLQSGDLLNELSEFNIIHAAIDEAHCVSEWGDSFRPSYLELGKVLSRLNIPVITAFTATASPPVLSRVTQILFDGEKPYLMQSASDRQNIHYAVEYACAKEKRALQLAFTEKRPMVVFCGTRALSEKTARLFREFLPADEVRFYHAGLTKEEKTATEQWFFPHKSAVLCCTCAFGMGVDKSDIRTVVHLEPSPTAESYIQEAGRGGRDGSVAKAILLWSLDDAMKSEKFLSKSRESVLGKFAHTEKCRRQVLLDALGAEQAVCSGCDICDARENGTQIIRYAKDAHMVYRFIALYSGRWTKEQAAEKLCHIANRKVSPPMYEPQDFLDIIEQMTRKKIFYLVGKKKKKVYLRNYCGKKCYSVSSSESSAGFGGGGATTRFLPFGFGGFLR